MMERVARRMRIYFFEGKAPENVFMGEPDIVNHYDENDGRILSSTCNNKVTSYHYDQDNRLVRETTDDEEGNRELVLYTYDPDGQLIRRHSEKREMGPHYIGKFKNYNFYNPEFYSRDEDDMYEPTGEYADEWYSWEDNGHRCVRELTIHAADGTVSHGSMEERYNDAHQVTERWMYKDPVEIIRHREFFFYSEYGTLERVEYHNVLGDDDDLPVLHINTEVYDEDERAICFYTDGEITRTTDYREDMEGNWIRATNRDGLGLIINEIVREITYTTLNPSYPDHDLFNDLF